MRIGFTIDKFIIGPGLPGIDKVCFNLVDELSGFEGVDVLLFQDKYKEDGEFGKFAVTRFPSGRDLPFVKAAPGGEGGGGEGDGFEPPSSLKLAVKDVLKKWAIGRSGIDILHYPTHLDRSYRLSSIPSVMTFHDLVPLIFGEMCTDRVKWELQESLKRLSRVDHFIAVSENTKKDMLERLDIQASDISVIYSGISSSYRRVDGKAIREKITGGRPYILFLGTVEPRKNLKTLLAALDGLDDDVCLVVSGHRGWGYREVTETIQRLSLGQRVLVTGYTCEDDLAALYSGAEVFVYPSWYEGFGLPPLEAMACGTAVASSTGGSLPEVLGDAALYYDPANEAEMRHIIHRLLNDEEIKEDLVNKGFKKAHEYTWQKCAVGVMDVYRKLV